MKKINKKNIRESDPQKEREITLYETQSLAAN